MDITVTAIGTCRVQEPFYRLKHAGRVLRDQRGVFGYTHNSKEALQTLRVMAGDLVVLPELRPFIMSRPNRLMDHPETRLNDLTGTDVLVVEMSSAKEIIFRDFYFQLVLTRKRLHATRSQAVLEWWRAIQRGGGEGEDLRATAANEDLPPIESAFVAEGKLVVQRPEEVRSDMEAMLEWHGGPILFVTHFDTPSPDDGQSKGGRAAMIAAIIDAGAELGCRVYDPTADVLAYAAEHGGLSAAITDTRHYTKAYIVDFLMDKILEEALAAMDMARVS